MNTEIPGIVSAISDEKTETNLDTNKTNKHAQARAWWAEPRWKGRQPQITEARAREIAAKRTWEKARELVPLDKLMPGDRFVAGMQSGALVRLDVWRAIASVCTGLVLAKLRANHRRLLVAVASAVCDGFVGVSVTHDELGEALGKSNSTSRRIVDQLVGLELLVEPLPMFEPRGAVTSRRGNAYWLAPYVLAGIARVPVHKNEQASGTGTGVVSGAPRSYRAGPSDPKGGRPPRDLSEEMPAHVVGVGVVEAERPELAVVADAAPCRLVADTRQGESCSPALRLRRAEVATERVTSSADYLALLHELTNGGAS